MDLATDPTTYWFDREGEAFRSRDRARASEAVRRLDAIEADLGPAWGPLGTMAATIGETHSAVAAARLLVRHDAGDPFARLALAERLALFGRHDEAVEVADALKASLPAYAPAWHLAGVCRIEAGAVEAGIDDLRQAMFLSDGPAASAWSWHAIAGAKRFQRDDPDLKGLHDALSRLSPSEDEARSILLYAVAKALDDVGDVDAAFRAVSEAARLAGDDGADELAFGEAQVDRALAFDAATLDELTGSGTESDRPIFVMGMPRSGTTLVERILAAHPDVIAGGELGLFPPAALGRNLSADGLKASLRADGTASRAVADAYLGMLTDRFGSAGRVVDKTLSHTRLVGPLQAVLPSAPMIWLRRSPGAVALSCFRTRFTRGLAWTRTLAGIARAQRIDDRLHAHWSGVLGARLLTVPYEALVADPEAWTRRLADHAGLAFAPEMLRPEAGEGPVATASHAQVRQPIHGGAAEAWTRYRRHLDPFFEAYQAP